MTQERTPFLWTIAGAVLLGVAAIAAVLPREAVSGTESVREIRLVARDMTFYLEGQTDPNPVLRVRRGERVRLVLRNEDAGMLHDVAVRAWSTGTPAVEGGGQSAVELRAPDSPGDEIYACTPHGEVMRGTIHVE
jgi:plastocyanin